MEEYISTTSAIVVLHVHVYFHNLSVNLALNKENVPSILANQNSVILYSMFNIRKVTSSGVLISAPC